MAGGQEVLARTSAQSAAPAAAAHPSRSRSQVPGTANALDQQSLLVLQRVSLGNKTYAGYVQEGTSLNRAFEEVAAQNNGFVLKVYNEKLNAWEVVAVKMWNEITATGDLDKLLRADHSHLSEAEWNAVVRAVRETQEQNKNSAKQTGGLHIFFGENGIPVCIGKNGELLFLNGDELKVNGNLTIHVSVVTETFDPKTTDEMNARYSGQDGLKFSDQAQQRIGRTNVTRDQLVSSHGGDRKDEITLLDTLVIVDRETGDVKTAEELAGKMPSGDPALQPEFIVLRLIATVGVQPFAPAAALDPRLNAPTASIANQATQFIDSGGMPVIWDGSPSRALLFVRTVDNVMDHMRLENTPMLAGTGTETGFQPFTLQQDAVQLAYPSASASSGGFGCGCSGQETKTGTKSGKDNKSDAWDLWDAISNLQPGSRGQGQGQCLGNTRQNQALEQGRKSALPHCPGQVSRTSTSWPYHRTRLDPRARRAEFDRFSLFGFDSLRRQWLKGRSVPYAQQLAGQAKERKGKGNKGSMGNCVSQVTQTQSQRRNNKNARDAQHKLTSNYGKPASAQDGKKPKAGSLGKDKRHKKPLAEGIGLANLTNLAQLGSGRSSKKASGKPSCMKPKPGHPSSAQQTSSVHSPNPRTSCNGQSHQHHHPGHAHPPKSCHPLAPGNRQKPANTHKLNPKNPVPSAPFAMSPNLRQFHQGADGSNARRQPSAAEKLFKTQALGLGAMATAVRKSRQHTCGSKTE